MRCHHWIRRQGAGVCVATRSGLTIDFDFTEGVVTDQRSLIVEPAAGDAPVAVQSGVEVRPPLPPFTRETATQKVRLAEGTAGYSRPRTRVAVGLFGGFSLAKPRRVCERQAGDHRAPDAQMGKGTRVPITIKELWAFDGARITVQGLCVRIARRVQATGSGLTATKTGSSTSTV